MSDAIEKNEVKFRFDTPQEDIDRCLEVEKSVTPEEMPLYMECMSGVPLSERVKNPRPEDCEGGDVRNGCILTGVFMQCRDVGENL